MSLFMSSSKFVGPKIDSRDNNPYQAEVQKMIGDGPDDLKENMNRFYLSVPNKNIKPINGMDDLLTDNFVIGERHQERASKHFLIQNLKALKDAGFTTIFLEHLYYNDQQVLDDYNPDSTPTNESKQLQNQLGPLDSYGSPLAIRPKEYELSTFIELIKEAKKIGIRIVAIDTFETYSEQYNRDHMEYIGSSPTGETLDNFRTKSMNYTACKIIENEIKKKPGKWCALVGNSHCRTNEGVPGLCDLTGARTVLIHNLSDDNSLHLTQNGQWTPLTYDNKPLTIPYELMIDIPPSLPMPMLSSASLKQPDATSSKSRSLLKFSEAKPDPDANTINASSNDKVSVTDENAPPKPRR